MTYHPKDKSTKQPSSNQEFAAIIRQQTFLAEFSQPASSCLDIAKFMGDLVKEVAHLLEVQFVQVVTLSDDQTVWDLRATTGWPKTFDRPATIQIKHPSQLSALLHSTKSPLIEPDIRNSPLEWLILPGHTDTPVSSVSQAISNSDQLFGILTVYYPSHRTLLETDFVFLQTVANILAFALKNQQTNAEIKQRNHELLALKLASIAITSSLDVQEALVTVAKSLAQLLMVPGCAIFGWNETDDTLTLLIYYGPDGWADKQQLGQVFTLANYPLSKKVVVERTSQQLTISQPNGDAAELAEMRKNGIKTLLMLPMIFQGRVIGLVEILDDAVERIFNDQEITTAQIHANQAASAIENARLHTETEQHFTHQSIVREAAAAIFSSLELNTVLNYTAKYIIQALRVTSIRIYDFHPDHGTIKVMNTYLSPEASPKEQNTGLATVHQAAQLSLATKYYPDHPVVIQIDEPTLSWDERSYLQAYGAKSVLYIPLQIVGRQLVYVELWESRQRREFSPEEIFLGQDIAQQAAAAIQNALLFDETQQRLTEQLALLEAGSVISATLDLDIVLSRIAEQIGLAIDATSTYIGDYDSQALTTTILAEYFSPNALPQERQSDLGVTYDISDIHDLAKLMNQGRIRLSHVDEPDLTALEQNHLIEFGAKSELIVPVRINKQVIACTIIWESRRKRDFTANEIALVQGIAQQAAIAIQNAQLYEQGQHYAETLEQRVSERTAELTQVNLYLQAEITEREWAERALQESNVTLQQRVDELAMLNQIIQTLTTITDLQTMLDTVTRTVVHLFQAQQSGVTLLNDAQTHFVVTAIYTEDPSKPNSVGAMIPIADNPSVAYMIETKKPLMILNPQIDPVIAPVHELMRQQNTACIMIVPLLVRGEIIGSLGIDFDEPGHIFTPDEIKLAETIAGQVAGAIDNARLFNKEHHQRQLAESLQEVSNVLNSSLDQNTVLNVIFDQLARVIHYDRAALFLSKNEDLCLTAGRNLPASFIGIQLKMDSPSPTVVAFRTQQALLVPDVQKHPDWYAWVEDEPIRAWMGAPLLIGEDAIGLLTLDNHLPGAYQSDDLQILQLFANQAAIAIQNAQLFAEAQQEIKERKRAEVALIVARDEALEASRLKTELLAKVSHEFRTPLSAILGYTEILHEEIYGSLSNRQHHITEEIIDSSHYLTSMVNDLLNQAQLEAGKLKLNIHPFEPAGLVEQIQSKMQLLAEPKGLTLITTIDPDLPSPILGDAIRLQQILVNLISNGIKFTESGSVQVTLTRHDQNYWAIHVVDTGSGIPKEVHTHIFEPFGQVDGSITRRYGGTGLGLSIVKQLTVLMGGQIQLESNLGQGSHFSVILPLLPTDQIEHLA